MSVVSDIGPTVVATPKLSRATTPRKDTTVLFNGESISKADKLLAAIGTLEELVAYLGVVKAEHFDPSIEKKFEIDSSSKLFLYARITQIQETLIDIKSSLGTSRKNVARYENSRFSNGEQRIKDLDHEIDLMPVGLNQLKESMREKPLQNIPGMSIVEARLMYARTICRRAERQVHSSKNLQMGIVVEDSCVSYLNRLGDYLLALSVHVLHMQNKEPLKKAAKSNTKTFQPNLK